MPSFPWICLLLLYKYHSHEKEILCITTKLLIRGLCAALTQWIVLHNMSLLLTHQYSSCLLYYSLEITLSNKPIAHLRLLETIHACCSWSMNRFWWYFSNVSESDPVIDEHFRRSLGRDYLALFPAHPAHSQTSPRTSPPPSPASRSAQQPALPSSVTLTGLSGV